MRHVLLVIILLGAVEGSARERVSVRISNPAEPRLAWGKMRLEEALKTAGYDLADDGRVVDVSVDPARVRQGTSLAERKAFASSPPRIAFR